METSLIARLLWIGWICFALSGPVPVAAELTDDEFLEALTSSSPDLPVDRARLAQLFHNVAVTLKAEKQQLGNMQQLIRVPSALRENALHVMASRFEGYSDSVTRFATEAAGLHREPRSTLRLYNTLREGQRTCWLLDLYVQLVGGWSGGGPELRVVMTSRAAFGPPPE